jgi:hypothetical protein
MFLLKFPGGPADVKRGCRLLCEVRILSRGRRWFKTLTAAAHGSHQSTVIAASCTRHTRRRHRWRGANSSASKQAARFLFLLCGPLFHEALGGFLLGVLPGVFCFAHVRPPISRPRCRIVHSRLNTARAVPCWHASRSHRSRSYLALHRHCVGQERIWTANVASRCWPVSDLPTRSRSPREAHSAPRATRSRRSARHCRQCSDWIAVAATQQPAAVYLQCL